MAGFPLPSTPFPVDRGHLLARASGGDEGIGINLVPQERRLNRGQGESGRRWRALERLAASDPGAWMFVGLAYVDAGDMPASFHVALVLTDGSARSDRLDNRPAG